MEIEIVALSVAISLVALLVGVIVVLFISRAVWQLFLWLWDMAFRRRG